MKYLLIVLSGLLLLGACEDDVISPDPIEIATDTIAKSPKRGISYNLTHALDFDTLKSGVSWWYNWYFETSAPENYYQDYQMEFIPMLWGANPSASDRAGAKQFILEHPEIEYLLVMNEPNLVDQANITPANAVATWIIYEQFVDELANEGRDLKLVGPAMNWGTMEQYQNPVDWLDAFYDEFQRVLAREPRIDYLAFHWYDYGLEAQLDNLQKYGKKIWITEMANWNANINSYDAQITQMTDMVHICETREDVFRYAWFIGRGGSFDNHYTYLFNLDPGDLNDLGYIYLNLPY